MLFDGENVREEGQQSHMFWVMKVRASYTVKNY